MKEYHILSLGAGVQSTTLYLMAMEGLLPITVAIFADTQDEPEAVYKHLEWLQSMKVPPILIRTKGRLGDDLARGVNSTRQRFASIPAFTDGPETGMVPRQCSKDYKTTVVEQTIRREVVGLEPRRPLPTDVTVYQYIGISWDERARAVDVERRMARNWKAVFPLIERKWTRADCKRFLAHRVPPTKYQNPPASIAHSMMTGHGNGLRTPAGPTGREWFRLIRLCVRLAISLTAIWIKSCICTALVSPSQK